MTLGSALAEAARRLGATSEFARSDAEVLLAHVLGCNRAALLANNRDDLPKASADAFFGLVERRAAGEPVAYLTGTQEFWSLRLAVTPDVLIPRPETELLVEWALEQLGTRFGLDSPLRRFPVIAELGTGSGAIALALAAERPGAVLVATDVSPAALAVAEGNARRLGLRNLQFRLGSWFKALMPLQGAGGQRVRFDLIVSNPPYVAETDSHLAALRYEPQAALVAGPDGLAALAELIAGAEPYLEPDGWLMLEHGHHQGEDVRARMRAAGFVDVETRRDLAGHERATAGRRP